MGHNQNPEDHSLGDLGSLVKGKMDNRRRHDNKSQVALPLPSPLVKLPQPPLALEELANFNMGAVMGRAETEWLGPMPFPPYQVFQRAPTPPLGTSQCPAQTQPTEPIASVTTCWQ